MIHKWLRVFRFAPDTVNGDYAETETAFLLVEIEVEGEFTREVQHRQRI